MEEKELKNEIIKLLAKNEKGLNILELSKLLKINRQTVSKYVYGLIEAGILTQYEKGRAKVCVLSERTRSFLKEFGNRFERIDLKEFWKKFENKRLR